MINFDELDLKILRENYNNDLIEKIDYNNISNIFGYLINNGIYYAKDLFLTSLDLFLLSYDDFVNKFEKLNPIFGKQPGVLRKKYGIDIKEYMIKYPIEELEFGGKLR